MARGMAGVDELAEPGEEPCHKAARHGPDADADADADAASPGS